MLHHNRSLTNDPLIAGKLDKVESHGSGRLNVASHTEGRSDSLSSPDSFEYPDSGEDVPAGRVDEDQDRVGLGGNEEVTDEPGSGEWIDFIREANERAFLEYYDGLLCGDCGDDWA
jgi:hypothetical protein